MNITVGTDPEVFFTEAGDSVYPAGLVFRDHYGTDVVETQYGALIVDGAALEFQPLPSPEPEEVVANLKGLLQEGLEMAAIADKRLAIKPELPFDLSWCKDDPSLGEFGCNPDHSAWGEECRPATIDASKHPWRYAGCHIHLGVVDDQDYFMRDGTIERVSQALDRTVGLASMVLSGNQDTRRRGVYGRPGIYRHQPWGMEYRTPSNMILRSPWVMGFIFKLTQATVELLNNHYGTMKAVVPDDVVIQVLRGDDLDLARELYKRMANVFCLDEIPPLSSHWERAWFDSKVNKTPYITSDTPWGTVEGAVESVSSHPVRSYYAIQTQESAPEAQNELPPTPGNANSVG